MSYDVREDWVGTSKGDKRLAGSGDWVNQWGTYMRGSRGGEIIAHKEKRFKTREAAIKHAKELRKSKKNLSINTAEFMPKRK